MHAVDTDYCPSNFEPIRWETCSICEDEYMDSELDDTAIREEVNPPAPGEKAIAEAAHAALWTEYDREASL